ncbi:lysophospholipid acyltransferase family protein [Terrihabitans sp. B22-R8]|uniref:lysophospholipid acyltransferase family protein n=1 Tax=Terrihabitans sp. B22-R8 TaxID=3425128 RepID=UPI00403D4E4E
MSVPGAIGRIGALTMLSLAGIPVQWALLKTGLPGARRVPWLYHRALNRIIRVRRHVEGAPAPQRPLLLLANHVSWLDISVLSAVLPVSFVAKSEVGSWPVFGLFARLQRTIFVDRTRRTATRDVTGAMARRLQSGDAIVLFAEGTSSDHNRVLPFRSALLGATRDALGEDVGERVWVQPVSITYTGWHGVPIGRFWRPRIAWYGDMTLPPHLWALLKRGVLDATISFGEPIAIDSGTDRKALARAAERQVREMTRRLRSGAE